MTEEFKMEENPIGRLMNTTMENVRNVLKTDTVVGDPITTPDGMMLVPISRISMGFGGGGIELNSKRSADTRPYGGGNATGVKIEPIGFLIIKDGSIRMVNVTPPANNTVDRIIEMVPQVIDKVDAFIEKQKSSD
jgi:sporulation protein YtfJ